MSRILARVRQLIALASSPEPEEARTAAVLACQLIREHGLKLSEAGTVDTDYDPPPPPRPPWQHPADTSRAADIGEVLDAFLRAMRNAQARRGPPPDRDWRRPIVARHGFQCARCGKYIERNTVCYARGVSATHYECGPEALSQPGDIG
jgi:Protein of unknown function (DUF2786)